MNSSIFFEANILMALLEIMVAGFVLFANRKALANRIFALFSLTIALNNIAIGNLIPSYSLASSDTWLLIAFITAYAMPPLLFLSAIAVLRPNWLRIKWIIYPIYALLVAQIAISISDATGLSQSVFGQLLALQLPTAATYQTGFTTELDLLFQDGILQMIFNIPFYGFLPLSALFPGLFIAITKRKKNPKLSQQAFIFTFIIVAVSIIIVLFDDQVPSSVVSIIVAIVWTGIMISTSLRLNTLSINYERLRETLGNYAISTKLFVIILVITIPVMIWRNLSATLQLQQLIVQDSGEALNGLTAIDAQAIGQILLEELEELTLLISQIPAGVNAQSAVQLLESQLQETENLTQSEINAQIRDAELAWQNNITSENQDNTLSHLANIQQLRRLVQSEQEHTYILLADKNGALVTASETPPNYNQKTNRWWAFATLNGVPQTYIGEPYQEDVSSDYLIDIVIPIYNESDEFLGFLYSKYTLAKIVALLDNSATLASSDRDHSDLFSSEGTHLSSSGTFYDHSQSAQVGDFDISLFTHDSTGRNWKVTDFEGSESIVAWSNIGQFFPDTPIEDINFLAISHRAYSSVTAPANELRNQNRIAGAITIFLTLGLTISLARFITRPIIALSEIAQEIQEGDLTARATIYGTDEIGTLGRAFNEMSNQLNFLVENLEEQVSNRTHDLTEQTQKLQAAADVGQAAGTIIDQEELIQTLVNIIQERFDLYYVGLFLTDEQKKSAVLRAGTGQGGQAMLARHHQMAIGEGMIGWSILNGQSRIAEHAKEDIVRLNIEELPDTRSEAAIPLRSRGQVIGALSVQSTEQDAFDETTLAILQTMADQIATAIDNARLIEQSQNALHESQTALAATQQAYQSITKESWNTQSQQKIGNWGYASVNGNIIELEHADDEKTEANTVKLPIKIRGYVAGHIKLKKDGASRNWAEDELELANSYAEQLGLTLESARLFQDTQRRSVQLQTSSAVSQAASSILDLEKLLPTAVELIGERFGLYYTGIFLVDDEMKDAVLRAGTGDAGRAQIEANHKLTLDQDSMIGRCITSGEAQIAFDVGEEATHFSNPHLPDTRTEMALPLRSRDEIIGALTIQSTQRAAFTQDDIVSFQTMADQLANAIDNARLFEESQESLSRAETQRRFADTMAKVAGRGTTTQNEQELLDILVEEINELIYPDQINLYRWDEAQNALQLVIRFVPGSPQDSYKVGDIFDRDSSPSLFTVFDRAKPEYSAEKRDDGLVHELYSISWLIGSKSGGVIEMFHTARGAHIGEQDRALIAGVIQQTASAFQSARNFKGTEIALTRTQALFQVGQAAIAMEDIGNLLQSIVETIQKTLPADKVLLLTLDTQKKKVGYFLQNDVPTGTLAHIPYEELMEGLTGWVVRERQPALSLKNIIDPREAPDIAEHRLKAGAGSIIVVPLLFRGRILGTITATNNAENRNFNEEDVDLMLAMANQTAAALTNATLLEEAQKQAESERIVNQISARLTQSLDFDSVLQAAVNELGKLPQVKGVSVKLGSSRKRDTNGKKQK